MPSPPSITVLDGYALNPGDNPWTPIEALGNLTVHEQSSDDPAEVLRRAAGADIVLSNKMPLSAAAIDQLPDLKFISVLATGYNIIDTAAARRRNIPVSNVPVYGTDSVAQFVFALLLELCHHVGHHDQRVHAGEWRRREWSFWDTPLLELSGKKMGIVGFGRIGRRVAELAHAFGMEVLAHDTQTGSPPNYQPFAFATLDDLFAQSDIISLHCPLTAENRGMINKALLAKMKKEAFLINTARGLLVNEPDLAEALHSGRIAGAALDVVSAEPIKPDNPLLTAPHCLLTPHMAWATLAARRRLTKTVAENIAAFIAGRPINVVN